ncbi:SRPBCC family protein [Kitasatospora sp. NPDC101801]|uniref:SRPBCC family protein n=1 Tax=Kitasatospora sp. NPDC101801 TaxID=3364103 RepID=UPI003830064F
MDANHYLLTSVWRFPAEPPRVVHRLLGDVERYPQWWPQVRSVRRLTDHSGELVIRSVLPYGLLLTITEREQDEALFTLTADLTGDLVGWSRWTVHPEGTGSRAVFEEEVRPAKQLMRRLAPVARPLFLANHAAMMRAGHRGLRRLLAGRA